MDIVYILKNGPLTEELRYSLRSLKNFPHGKVWFFGGAPEGIKPDEAVEFQQEGETKWERVRNSLYKVCRTEEITPDFWLFNDDFFCMKPCMGIPTYYNGDLYSRVAEITERNHGASAYSKELRRTAQMLESEGCGVLNYAVHLPMLINRHDAIKVLDAFSDVPMFRSLYGNYMSVGGVDRKDVKIYSPLEEPDHEADWLSTTDISFRFGKVGVYIRSVFQAPSEYEQVDP